MTDVLATKVADIHLGYLNSDNYESDETLITYARMLTKETKDFVMMSVLFADNLSRWCKKMQKDGIADSDVNYVFVYSALLLDTYYKLVCADSMN